MKETNQATKQEKLLELLQRYGLVGEEQLKEARELSSHTNKTIEEFLIDKNIVDAEELTIIKANVYGLPYQSLSGKKLITTDLEIIPAQAAENYKVICFEKKSLIIKIGIVDPDNFKAIEAIDFLAKKEGLHPEYYLISPLSLADALGQYKSINKEISSVLQAKQEENDDYLAKFKGKESVQFEEVIKSAPVAKIVSVLMRHAIEGRASDIHIEPLQNETRVRYRIDGVLHTSLVLPQSVHSAIVSRIKVLANLKLDETRLPQDGRIRLEVNDKEVDLRISILPLINEEKVVMRILDITKGAPTLEELGFEGQSLDVIKKNIKKTDGLFLVTGPTGSGKSTTLYSILTKINKENINIVTLEDPVEYFLKGINQSQVKPEIGYTFASGLRSFLRQDPNIIMVGEIRDHETVELAIHASLTGHFVYSTLHTNDAIGSIARLLDMGVEPFLLSSTLNTIIAQRLARKICLHCKIASRLPDNIANEIEKETNKIPRNLLKERIKEINKSGLIFYKGAGCPRCGNTGYNGRIALAEVLDINEDLRDLIMIKNANLKQEDIAATQNFITMKQDGIIKALQGVTSIEEMFRVINN